MLKNLCSFLLCSLLLAGQSAQAQLVPNPDFLSGAGSHTYKSVDGVTLRLHVFQPHSDSVEPRAAIIFSSAAAGDRVRCNNLCHTLSI